MKWTSRAEDKLNEIGFVVPGDVVPRIRQIAEEITKRNLHKNVGVPQVKGAYRQWFYREKNKS